MYKKVSAFLFAWRNPLLLISAFILGALTGVFAESAFLITELKSALGRGPELISDLVQHRLTSRLGLDAKQQAELKPILNDAIEKVKVIRSQVAPQVQAVIADSADRIEKILRPDQVKLLHEGEARAREQFGTSPFFPTQMGSTPSTDSH